MTTKALTKAGTAILVLLALGIAACDDDGPSDKPPVDPPRIKLEDFTSAEVCKNCHPNQYNDWSGSMHAYAVKDPVWLDQNDRAQIATAGALDQFCIQCHSPVALLTASIPAEPIVDITDLPQIIKEGVTCDFCHSVVAPAPTAFDSVQYSVMPGDTKFGPISDPANNPFHESEYRDFFERSVACGGCHNLVVNGVPTEMTMTEWDESPYSAMTLDCQDCHMPKYSGFAAAGGPMRDNLHKHNFIGVDVALTDFPNKDEQRAAVAELLRNSATMVVDVDNPGTTADSVAVNIAVHNDQTGHNIPTGVFFARQMWIEVTIEDAGGGIVYQSGQLDANGDLMDSHSILNPNGDPDLTLFGGTLFDALGQPDASTFELASLENHSIPAFSSRNASYRFQPVSGTLTVRVRLLFRPMQPWSLRGTEVEHLIPEIPVFEMALFETNINIS